MKFAISKLLICAIALQSALSLAAVAAIDPFDPGATAVQAGGKNKGQALDLTEKRAISRLTDAEKKLFFGAEIPNGVIVKNVFHNGAFYVAAFPQQGPSSVIGILEHFPPEWIAGHTFWRFQFAEPVKLYRSQIGDGIKHSLPDAQVSDVAFTVEYHAPPGIKYNLFKGLHKDVYNIVHRLTSLDAKIDSMIKKQHHKVDQWKLELSPAQNLSIFEAALTRAEEAGYKESYNTYLESCTTELLVVLDRGLGVRHYFPLFFGRVPVLLGNALGWRKLRLALQGDGIKVTRLKTLNEEFGVN